MKAAPALTKVQRHARGICTQCHNPVELNAKGLPYWLCKACRVADSARYYALKAEQEARDGQ